MNNPPKQDLQPAYQLWKMYRPDEAPYRFQATSIPEAKRWQVRTRRALNHVLGFQNLPRVPFEPVTIERVDKGDYIREKLIIRTSPHTLMPVYLLFPRRIHPPYPVVLALHGHGYGVRKLLGCVRMAASVTHRKDIRRILPWNL